jgi:hypothetical protein
MINSLTNPNFKFGSNAQTLESFIVLTTIITSQNSSQVIKNIFKKSHCFYNNKSKDQMI